MEKNQLVSKAAKKLGLRLSTAKLIIKRYKDEGTFFESKVQAAKREENAAKTIRIKSKDQNGPPLAQSLINPLPENNVDTSNNNLNVAQFFYLQDIWAQTYPLSFPVFQDMMVCYF